MQQKVGRGRHSLSRVAQMSKTSVAMNVSSKKQEQLFYGLEENDKDDERLNECICLTCQSHRPVASTCLYCMRRRLGA